MSAYMIFVRNGVHDHAEMDTYTELARQSDDGFDVTTLVRYGQLEVLEGRPVEGIYMSRFPSIEEARAWYEGPAYEEARQHRLRGADYDVYLIDGVE